jgi:hypothetical protein
MVYPWSTDRSRPTPYRDTKPFIILSFPSGPQEVQPSRMPQCTPYPPASLMHATCMPPATLTHATVRPIPSSSEPASTPSPAYLGQYPASTSVPPCPTHPSLPLSYPDPPPKGQHTRLTNSWLQTHLQTAVLSLSTQTSWLTNQSYQKIKIFPCRKETPFCPDGPGGEHISHTPTLTCFSLQLLDGLGTQPGCVLWAGCLHCPGHLRVLPLHLRAAAASPGAQV